MDDYDPEPVIAAIRDSLLDARPMPLIVRDLPDTPEARSAVARLIVAVIELYKANGGDDMDFRVVPGEAKGSFEIYFKPKDRPPPDDLYRWAMWRRLASWLRRRLA